MKKLTAVLFGVVMLLITAACQKQQEKEEISVSSVSLDKTSAALKVGETLTLTATVLPADATDKTLKWSSSATAVATVSDGVVTAVSEGVSTITVSAGSKVATCVVTVKDDPIAVSSITLDMKSAVLYIGETATLIATVLPENATDKTVTWTSSKPDVATVEGGVVKAIAEGTSTITAAAGEYTATCEISVIPPTVDVTGVSLDKKIVDLTVGQSVSLVATVQPADASDKSVTWTSSVPGVATVTAKGKVTALEPGTSVITVRTNDGGYEATCTITVTKAIAEEGATLEDMTLEEDLFDSEPF